jgi:hypothetical protein
MVSIPIGKGRMASIPILLVLPGIGKSLAAERPIHSTPAGPI